MNTSRALRKTGIVLVAGALAACQTAESSSGSTPPVFGAGATSGIAGGAAGAVGVGAAGSAAGGVGVGGSGSISTTVLSRAGLAPRLGKFEYQNSITDVLGVSLLSAELDANGGGLPDDAGDGVLKHLADKQTSTEQYTLAYSQVADGVAKRVDIAALSARLGVCVEATAACGAAFVRSVGRRLFRRPLEEREVSAMAGVYDAARSEMLGFGDSARWALRALLQAPPFLFRLEKETSGQPNQPRQLDGYELATRLSSFLWVSVPDEELLSAAADGSLVKPEVLKAQVTRMLADPKAHRLTEVFASDFSRARFASFEGSTDADRAALNESVVATFQDHFWTRNGSVADLFTTTHFVVNEATAGLLGLPMKGSGLQSVDVASSPQRVGLLSHPAMIAGMGDRGTGSFVNRGKYLMERLLCRNPINVPDSLGEEIQTFTATTAGLNEPERSAIRQSRALCWSCHKQFEPLSFGFARFDGAGRYVGETDATGKPLPLAGWVPTNEAQEPQYTDMPSYMHALATDPVIQTCMTEHFIAFATARSSDELAKIQAESVSKEYQTNGSSLPAMVAAVAQSELFRTILTLPSSQGTMP